MERSHKLPHSKGQRHQRSSREYADMSGMSESTRHPYPAHQPFINDSNRRYADKLSEGYPENNRQAVMAALKNLQDKIRALERERTNAEKNLKSLTEETSKYRDLMQDRDITQRSLNTSGYQQNYYSHTDSKELKEQLDQAEGRSELLQRQLDYMKRLVETSEREKSEALQRAQQLEQISQQEHDYQVRAQLEKVAELERDQLRQTALQSLAQNKIRELEQQQKEDQQYRKMMQETLTQLQTKAEKERILEQSKKPAPKKKKKKNTEKSTAIYKSDKQPYKSSTNFSTEHSHYHLKLSQIPFITGKSATASHSVPANVQKVLAMMKSHSPRLCPTSPSVGRQRYRSGKTSDDLADLLLQLQDEFSQMSVEHQELSRQLHDTTDHRMREGLDHELESLVARMEVKGDQIAKLRDHQHMLSEKKRKKKVKEETTQRPSSAMARLYIEGDVEMKTTIRPKTGSTGGAILYSHPDSPMQAKTFLSDLKKIQTTLRKDDLSWDC